jgi:hypothetical protein
LIWDDHIPREAKCILTIGIYGLHTRHPSHVLTIPVQVYAAIPILVCGEIHSLTHHSVAIHYSGPELIDKFDLKAGKRFTSDILEEATAPTQSQVWGYWPYESLSFDIEAIAPWYS